MLPLGQAPKSLMDLGQARYKGKIVMATPSLSGSAYAQLAQMLQLHGWDLVRQVINNTTFVMSSKLVYKNVGKGETAVGITGDYNVIKMRDKGYPVTAVYPGEGTGLRFDATDIIANGPNPETAKRFVDFGNSREAHEIMVTLRKRRSVRIDVSAPKGQIPTADVPTFDYDINRAASERKATLLNSVTLAGIADGAIIVFAILNSEMSVTILLYSAKWKTVSIAIFELVLADDLLDAAALGSITIVLTLALIARDDVLGRKLQDAGLPTRARAPKRTRS